MFQEHKPDVVLMDLRLPEISGVEATQLIYKRDPQARVIILSTYDSEEDIYRAFQAGARGYILKTVLREELLTTIRDVHADLMCIPPAVAQRLAGRMSQPELTERGLEVLRYILKGMSNKEIGAVLSVCEATIKLHVSNLFSKLQVTDRTQAATTALQRGIVRLEDSNY